MKTTTTKNRFWLRAAALAALARHGAGADPCGRYGHHLRLFEGRCGACARVGRRSTFAVDEPVVQQPVGAGLSHEGRSGRRPGVWAQIETNARGQRRWPPGAAQHRHRPGHRQRRADRDGPVGSAAALFRSVYAIDPFTAGIFASNSIMGNGFATGANGVSPTSFDRRQPNLLQYWPPNLSNFEFRLAYAMPEEKTEDKSPNMGGLVTYRNGPLYAAWGCRAAPQLLLQRAARMTRTASAWRTRSDPRACAAVSSA